MTLLDMRRRLDQAELNFREASLNGVVSAVDDLFCVMQSLVAHVAAAEGVSIEEPEPEAPDFEQYVARGPFMPFESTGRLRSSRGVVLTGAFPFADGTDAVGLTILVNGSIWRIAGVERFAVLRDIRKGDPIGFILGRVSL